jgi:hypothetical protein
MPVERSQIIAILKRIHLFRGADDQQLETTADFFEAIDLPAGTVIYEQGDDPDYFYLIASGKVRLSRVVSNDRPVLLIGDLEDDDYFGEEVLETEWARQVTVETLADTTLLRIDVPNFVQLLNVIPPLSHRLQFILDSYRLSLKTHLRWQAPDETVYFIARRHALFLWARILPPTLFGIFTIPLTLYLYLNSGSATAGLAVTPLIALIAALVITAFWWVWSYIDWSNDYYVVTNRRVVYQERVVLFYDSRQEAPLEAIQSSSTTSSQLGRWLGYGNVAIRTFIGNILFGSVSFPEQVVALIQEHQLRAQFNQYRSELKNIRETLKQRMYKGPASPQQPKTARPSEKPDPVRQFLSTMFHLRYESGGTVIFRTHWFILLKRIFFPTLLIVAVIAALIASAYDQFKVLSAQATCGITFLAGLFALSWWFYQYLDWHNDLYLITPDQVIDVNKKPLGQEERRAAPIKNILSIEYKRLGIIGLMLNFGTVYIRVGDQQLTFDDVFNPSEVQRELFQRLAAKNFAEKQAAAEVERRRLADWIAIYDETQRQNPPPPRTQPPARGGF